MLWPGQEAPAQGFCEIHDGVSRPEAPTTARPFSKSLDPIRASLIDQVPNSKPDSSLFVWHKQLS